MFEHGADPNFVNQYGSSAFLGCLGGGMVVGSSLPATRVPIKFAASCGSFDVALYLIDRGAEPKKEEFREEVRSKLGNRSAVKDFLETSPRAEGKLPGISSQVTGHRNRNTLGHFCCCE